MRERIKEAPCAEVIKYLFRPAMDLDLKEHYQFTVDVNKAHVLMLAEEGIIEKNVAKKIIQVNLEIAKMQAKPKFEIDFNKEDLYFNMEKYLIDQTNMHIGGQQHTARSRNDMQATIARMHARRQFFVLSEIFIKMRKTILAAAKENLDAIMSGYTHLQPSEPSTLGAYFSAILSALERDYRRFAASYLSLNLCPLGGCAMASTSFPINRKTTAKLLGFDAPIASSIDCVASRDYALEMVSALAMTANTLSRLAQDLYIWSTPEYNYIEVNGSVSVCSSIMPQKKNAMTLEHMKGKAAHLEGFFVSIFSAMKNVAFMHCRDISSESIRFLWAALDEAEAQMMITIPTIKTLTVKRDVMLNNAKKNFCAVTELANYLVIHDHIAFREAHTIVGELVAEMMSKGKTALDINHDLIEDVSQRLFKHGTKLTNELIFKALDPTQNVAAKHYEGGSAPKEVKRQLAKLEKVILADEKLLAKRQAKVEASGKLMNSKVKTLLGK